MELPKFPVECPGCGITKVLSIKSINRRVRCPSCAAEFIAIPGEPLRVLNDEPEILDRRHLEMLCVSTGKTFTLTFQRRNSEERYQLVTRDTVADLTNTKSIKGDTSTNARNETFDNRELDWTGFQCKECGSSIRLLNRCCNVLFCGALAVEVDNRRYANCPACKQGGYYDDPIIEIYGQASQTISPPRRWEKKQTSDPTPTKRASPKPPPNAVPAALRKLIGGKR
jgi:hypothetical protein